jgi:hypothetical protein
MTRPGLCASRSSTVQRTEAPVETSVTSTTVPNANVGLAQVPAGDPYHEANPAELRCGTAATATTGIGAGRGASGATAPVETASDAPRPGGAGGGGVLVEVVVVVEGNA